MTRYVPSRHYLQAGLAALVFGAFSAWCGWNWAPAYLAAGLFVVSAAVLLFLSRRPAIEIHETHIAVGRRAIPWSDVRAVDRTGWGSLVLVRLTLADSARLLVIHPGDVDSAASLLRHLRRYSREALAEPAVQAGSSGIPSGGETRPLASPRYRLLLPEDEAEVERLYQRLKAVRHLDPDNSGDEK